MAMTVFSCYSFSFALFQSHRGGVCVLFYHGDSLRAVAQEAWDMHQAGVCEIMVTQGENRKDLQYGMASVSFLCDTASLNAPCLHTGVCVSIYIIRLRARSGLQARMVMWFRGQVRQAIIVLHSSPMYVNSSPEPLGVSMDEI